jgi:hypothetical protein
LFLFNSLFPFISATLFYLIHHQKCASLFIFIAMPLYSQTQHWSTCEQVKINTEWVFEYFCSPRNIIISHWHFWEFVLVFAGKAFFSFSMLYMLVVYLQLNWRFLLSFYYFHAAREIDKWWNEKDFFFISLYYSLSSSSYMSFITHILFYMLIKTRKILCLDEFFF